jgi:hypothetical protein
VPVKKNRNILFGRTLALVVAGVLGTSSPSFAQDPGAPLDDERPRIIHLEDGSYLLNDLAWNVVNAEVKRLQGVERLHKAEDWKPVVFISAGIGTLMGALSVVLFYWAGSLFKK